MTRQAISPRLAIRILRNILPSPAPRERVTERKARRRVRVLAVAQTLTLPSLRDGPLPLPQCGTGTYSGTLSCFFHGFCSCLPRSIASPRHRRRRVAGGG